MTKTERLKKAIHEAIDLLKHNPAGYDLEADPENESPEDASVHIVSLAMITLMEAIGMKTGEWTGDSR